MTKNVYQSYGCFCRRGLGYNKDSQGHQEMFQLHQRRKGLSNPIGAVHVSIRTKVNISRVRIRRISRESRTSSLRRIDARPV